MAEEPGPRSPTLRALYWRSEILQVLYWLRGEGLGESVDAQLIQRFLGVDAAIGTSYLERLADDGYLERDAERYRLSPLGLEEGAVEFHLSFAELTRPSHGECSADCWCHASIEEAEACAAERAGKAPG
ncbi:MAG: hypothetical protein M3415_04810 [Actinomycetota bacterium]|nr:hypothetical protein [Actinomycetota bacterium]